MYLDFDVSVAFYLSLIGSYIGGIMVTDEMLIHILMVLWRV